MLGKYKNVFLFFLILSVFATLFPPTTSYSFKYRFLFFLTEDIKYGELFINYILCGILSVLLHVAVMATRKTAYLKGKVLYLIATTVFSSLLFFVFPTVYSIVRPTKIDELEQKAKSALVEKFGTFDTTNFRDSYKKLSSVYNWEGRNTELFTSLKVVLPQKYIPNLKDYYYTTHQHDRYKTSKDLSGERLVEIIAEGRGGLKTYLKAIFEPYYPHYPLDSIKGKIHYLDLQNAIDYNKHLYILEMCPFNIEYLREMDKLTDLQDDLPKYRNSWTLAVWLLLVSLLANKKLAIARRINELIYGKFN